jgi:hypothetical protein
VNKDACAGLALEHRSQAAVIFVRVCQDDSLEIGEPEAEPSELGFEGSPRLSGSSDRCRRVSSAHQ